MPARRFRYNIEARAELAAAAEWYEVQRSGLALELLDAVAASIDEILEAPGRWPLHNGVRKVIVGRFPYTVIYREVSDEEIEIVAVAHARRRPNYWARR